MSAENDLALAYHMGYDDALAKRKPDASQTQILASYDLADENAKLRELVRILYYCGLPWKDCDKCAMNGAEMHVKISEVEFCDGMYDRMRELGVEVDG